MEYHRNRITTATSSNNNFKRKNDNAAIIRLATKTAGIEEGKGGDDTRWRRYGQAYRRELLEKDKKQGGTVFTLNPSCGIDRYHIVSQRALEQFRRMYEKQSLLSSSSLSVEGSTTRATCTTNNTNLEEMYIMGNRIVCFLAEYLPKHPHYMKREVSDIRSWSRQELQHMKDRLDEISLLIDEEQLNKYITVDFDPIVQLDDEDDDDDDDDQDDNEENDNDLQKWDPFAAKSSGSTSSVRSNADSPTVETVGTTGTGSIAIDETSSEDSTSDKELGSFHSGVYHMRHYHNNNHHHHYSPGGGGGSSPPSPRYVFRLDAEFLERIAQEKVRYETDSEAFDSWAQDGDAASGTGTILSATSSGPGENAVSYDPARIALRDVFNRIPTTRSMSKKISGTTTTTTTRSSLSASARRSVSAPSPVKEEESVTSNLSSSLDTSISSSSSSSIGGLSPSRTTSPTAAAAAAVTIGGSCGTGTPVATENSNGGNKAETFAARAATTASGPCDEKDHQNNKIGSDNNQGKENASGVSGFLKNNESSTLSPFTPFVTSEVIDQDEWVSFDDGDRDYYGGKW